MLVKAIGARKTIVSIQAVLIFMATAIKRRWGTTIFLPTVAFLSPAIFYSEFRTLNMPHSMVGYEYPKFGWGGGRYV